jgi:hypothetical protein
MTEFKLFREQTSGPLCIERNFQIGACGSVLNTFMAESLYWIAEKWADLYSAALAKHKFAKPTRGPTSCVTSNRISTRVCLALGRNSQLSMTSCQRTDFTEGNVDNLLIYCLKFQLKASLYQCYANNDSKRKFMAF